MESHFPGYIQVDITKVPIGSEIGYFKNPKERRILMKCTLKNRHATYITVSDGNSSWHVMIKDMMFLQKQPNPQPKDGIMSILLENTDRRYYIIEKMIPIIELKDVFPDLVYCGKHR